MRKAFTLIELLVVIAIIAILAAILFPVFAQAKTAAKKTMSINNVKQFGLGLLMYTGDHDDTYPRNDDCVAKSSLNSDLNKNGAVNGDGCSGAGPYPYRMNHYSWQKWIMPYVKNIDIFRHPKFPRVEQQWKDNGQLYGYALNLALTGALNTWGDPNRNGANRASFLGGTQTAIPDPSSAMIFMEFASASINFAPVFTTPNARNQTAYPVALRRLWAPFFLKWRSKSDCTPTEQIDPITTPWGEHIVMGRVDGSAATINVKRFLANTPTDADYVTSGWSGWNCGPTDGARTIASAPRWSQSWPMWALDY